ncbi:CrcB family protein [Synechococcus sp. RSCCF101]|uniref:FluC/FEX family fluoride channel n=1 Tax=Synechococcus sp. RSCCF101 TaxID=2511069 RepID=UPI0012472373|nr:CrcB family protein [Synechococcus sp. RSCCF101]QEY32516.1 CrcB family protein [Synechococcus sp. RSCCF101]
MSASPPPSLRTEAAELLLVALGAVPGALLRWQVGNDLIVNTLGSLLLGLLAGLPLRPRRQLLLGVGFCGSVTTFSGWMVECLDLLLAGRAGDALSLIGWSFLLGLGAAAGGFSLGRRLCRPGRSG